MQGETLVEIRSPDRHVRHLSGQGHGDYRALLPRHGLVDRADLTAVAQPDRLDELGAAAGVDRGPFAGAGDKRSSSNLPMMRV